MYRLSGKVLVTITCIAGLCRAAEPGLDDCFARERQALRAGHRLAWSLTLGRQIQQAQTADDRAEAERLRHLRSYLLDPANGGAFGPEDQRQATAWACADADRLGRQILHDGETAGYLGSFLDDLVEAGCLSHLTRAQQARACRAIESALLAGVLRSFDAGQPAGPWLDHWPRRRGWDLQLAFLTGLAADTGRPNSDDRRVLDWARSSGALTDLEAVQDPQLKLELLSLCIYARWITRRTGDAGDASLLAMADALQVDDDSPAELKRRLARLLAGDKSGITQAGSLPRLSVANLPRWNAELAILNCYFGEAQCQPQSGVVSFITAHQDWYANRAGVLSVASFQEMPVTHGWFAEEVAEPAWFASRRQYEREVEELIGQGALDQAFVRVQQMKCLPLDAEVTPTDASSLTQRFIQRSQVWQKYYLEYFVGSSLQGVFLINFEDGASLTWYPLTLNGSFDPASATAEDAFPADLVVALRDESLRVTVAPDGPLWGHPLEACRFDGGTLGIRPDDELRVRDSWFSYTPTAAALSPANASIDAGAWRQCWMDNWGYAQRQGGASQQAGPGHCFRDSRAKQFFFCLQDTGVRYSARLATYSSLAKTRLALDDLDRWSVILFETGPKRLY